MRDASLAVFIALFGPEFGRGERFDLQKLRGALAALGAPHENLPPTVHVAGTNGKGSTIAFMAAITEAAGLRVHAFTKPHLLTLRERFRVVGAEIGDDALIAAARRIASLAPGLSQFEAQVAAAFTLFAETPADLALIEAGMGGRDDATNLLTQPAMCVLTPIALDHQDALGPTLADIAAHKAGILKPGAPCVVARQQPEASAMIEARAGEIGARLLRQGIDWDAHASAGALIVQTETRALDLPLPSLAGAHQADNAGLAAAALLYADIAGLDDAHYGEGIARARWPGRLQPITRGLLAAAARGAELWLDGAHNKHGALALARWATAMQARRVAPLVVIFGALARKDWTATLQAIAPAAHTIIATPLADGGAPASEITAYARSLGARARVAPSLAEAIEQAGQFLAPRILICGSLALVGEALALGEERGA